MHKTGYSNKNININAYFSADSVNLASLSPTLRTNKVFVDVCFTGQTSKLTLSGKSSIARDPIAVTGTINFSLSVMHTNS